MLPKSDQDDLSGSSRYRSEGEFEFELSQNEIDGTKTFSGRLQFIEQSFFMTKDVISHRSDGASSISTDDDFKIAFSKLKLTRDSKTSTNDRFSTTSKFEENFDKMFKFYPCSLTFLDPYTQRRFQRFMVTQCSWLPSFYGITCPTCVLLSFYIGSMFHAYLLGDIREGSATEVVGYLSLFLLAMTTACIYIHILRELNETFPAQRLLDSNAKSFIISRLRLKYGYSTPIAGITSLSDVIGLDLMSESDRVYHDAMYSISDDECSIETMKFKRILRASFCYSLSMSISIVFFGLFTVYDTKCNFLCIKEFPLREFMLLLILPSFFLSSMVISWSAVCSSILTQYLLVLFLYIIPREILTLDSSASEVLFIFIFASFLLAFHWFQFRQRLQAFKTGEIASFIASKYEHEFALNDIHPASMHMHDG